MKRTKPILKARRKKDSRAGRRNPARTVQQVQLTKELISRLKLRAAELDMSLNEYCETVLNAVNIDLDEEKRIVSGALLKKMGLKLGITVSEKPNPEVQG